MQLKYKLNQDKKEVTVKMSGIVDIDEFIVFYGELMAKIEGKGIISLLWDTKNLDMSNVTADQIQKAIMHANNWSSIRKGGKSIWLVYDLLSYGIVRMLENMAEARNLFDQDINFEIVRCVNKNAPCQAMAGKNVR